jgi:hypothetical protein
MAYRRGADDFIRGVAVTRKPWQNVARAPPGGIYPDIGFDRFS